MTSILLLELVWLVLANICAVTGVSNTRFELYSCPLSSSLSSLSSNNKDCSSSGKRDLTYGFKHTYIKIGSQCYDWGNWNYPRRLSCTDPDLACCVQTRKLETSGYTSCADRVGEFENKWRNQGIRYDIYIWNCQRYSNQMKIYIENDCNVSNVLFVG